MEKDPEVSFNSIAHEDLWNDPRYKEQMEIAIEIGRKIMAVLGPDKSLFLQYERASCLAKEIRLEHAYQLGLISRKNMPNRMPNKV